MIEVSPRDELASVLICSHSQIVCDLLPAEVVQVDVYDLICLHAFADWLQEVIEIEVQTFAS